jgi:hypothetical protein
MKNMRKSENRTAIHAALGMEETILRKTLRPRSLLDSKTCLEGLGDSVTCLKIKDRFTEGHNRKGDITFPYKIMAL